MYIDREEDGIQLEKGRVYKVITPTKSFKRDYMIFSLRENFYYNFKYHCIRPCLFIINMDGELRKDDAQIGIWDYDVFKELNANDLFELSNILRGTRLRYNRKTKKIEEI